MKPATPRNLQRLGYRRIVQLLVYLVVVPAALLLSLGILVMVVGEARITLVLGILTVSFVAVVVTGVVLVLVFLRREANLSELQADFVSKVSHELRTPLTAIRLFAETMERARDDKATLDKCLGLLTGETEKLTLRIERLLDWGRMEAGRRLYTLADEDIGAVLREAVEMFSPVRYDTMDFAVEIDGDLPRVTVDRAALVDAVVNLLSNARKYGGTPPKVRLAAKRTPSGSVAIAVTDNGQGIVRREHRRIFEKFYRIDDRLSRTQEGSGLGLAIVNHVVRAHRGKVAVDSEIGKGSTFTIVLPVRPPRGARHTAAAETHGQPRG